LVLDEKAQLHPYIRRTALYGALLIFEKIKYFNTLRSGLRHIHTLKST